MQIIRSGVKFSRPGGLSLGHLPIALLSMGSFPNPRKLPELACTCKCGAGAKNHTEFPLPQICSLLLSILGKVSKCPYCITGNDYVPQGIVYMGVSRG